MSTQKQTNKNIPMETENHTPSPEELQVEQESLAVVQDADIRSSLIDSLGLEDGNYDDELINKLVEREKSNRQKLSGAIGAKIKYREQASKFNQIQNAKADDKPKANLDADAIRKQTEETVRAQFDEEYLEESDFSDNLKSEMRKIAKLNGTTVRTASKDSYIQHLVEKETAEKRALEAANNGGGGGKGTRDNEGEMPSRFNNAAYMATEKGRADYDAWAERK